MNRREKLKNLLSPSEISDELADIILSQATDICLNRRYPFGYEEGTLLPKRYENVMFMVAVELFNKMGAEGEISHSENGISRTYSSADVSRALLRRIIPLVGGISDERT